MRARATNRKQERAKEREGFFYLYYMRARDFGDIILKQKDVYSLRYKIQEGSMTYKLYYADGTASMGVRVLLEEIGAPYQLIQTTTDRKKTPPC